MTNEQYKRIEILQQKMAEQGLDAMLVSSQDALFYLCGASYLPLERPFFIVIHREGVPDLVVPALEQAHMSKVEGLGEVKSYFEFPSKEGENWYDKLCELTGENVVIGVEPSLPSVNRERIRAKETVITDVIDRMRCVKTEDELKAIRLACQYTDYGMNLLYDNLYRGMSVLETSRYASTIQQKVVKETPYNYFTSSFLTAGWPAPKSAQPHSLPDLNSRMGDGPIVLMSFNRVNGYAAELERTVFLGEPTAQERELFEHVMKARDIAYGMVRPGVACSDIDQATQDYFKEQGLDQYILHRTGHGIGMGNHEPPWLSVGSDFVLEKNMVISVEPGLYLPDIGGFRHSDTVLVTDTGFEIMTSFPDKLEEVIKTGQKRFAPVKGRVIRAAVGYKEPKK